MKTQIDDALAHLSADAAHPGLDGLESRVFDVLSRQPTRVIGSGATLAAAAFALVLGAFSNVVPAADAQAAPTLSPFAASNPLAPSTLLVGP